MARQSDEEVQKEILEETLESGSLEDLEDMDVIGKDTEEDLERAIGNKVDPEEDGFDIAEEVGKDEQAISEGADVPKGDDEELSLEEIDEDALASEDDSL